jgi:hypothetical protein
MTKNKDKPRSPISNLYAIRDLVASVYLTPFVSHSNSTARRMFRSLLTSSEKNQLSENPHDYDLYWIGDFDPVDGQIDPLDNLELVAKGCDMTFVYRSVDEGISERASESSQSSPVEEYYEPKR